MNNAVYLYFETHHETTKIFTYRLQNTTGSFVLNKKIFSASLLKLHLFNV